MNNKYQEALYSILKDNPKVNLTTSDIHKDIRLLHELVDKETPKKTEYKYISKEREYLGSDAFHFIKVVHGDCPICGETLSEDKKYCPECGQKLDWSE